MLYSFYQYCSIDFYIIDTFYFCNRFADLINKKTRSSQKELSVKNKSCLKNDTSNFTPTKQVTIVPPKIYPQLVLKKSIVLTAKTMTNVSTEVCTKLYSFC